jgi:hypothetical protein
LEPEVIEKLKKDKKLPTRVDWISGNPKDNPPGRRRNFPDEDYKKIIYEIKDDQTVVDGTVKKNKNGTYSFSGTFRTAGGLKAAADLTDAEKKAIQDDLERERADLTNAYPGVLASVVPPPPGADIVENENDADDDGARNGRDTCVVVYDPAQTDSLGDGRGDACRTVLKCDTDLNGTIDLFDIGNIMAARGLPVARFAPDPRDWDGDGKITVNDARVCSQRCQNSNCAP